MQTVIGFVLLVLWMALLAWIADGAASSIRRWNDAQLLARVADDAAALVTACHPQAQWTNQHVMVQQHITSAGIRVYDAKAIERAAAGALVRLGIRPPR
jgi:hypothetical protein